jgi:hypothetical protein
MPLGYFAQNLPIYVRAGLWSHGSHEISVKIERKVLLCMKIKQLQGLSIVKYRCTFHLRSVFINPMVILASSLTVFIFHWQVLQANKPCQNCSWTFSARYAVLADQSFLPIKGFQVYIICIYFSSHRI